MTLVEIDYSLEPECLSELKKNPESKYENLQGDCRKQVMSIIKLGQNFLCAYCQKSIEDTMTIEHYYSQSEFGSNDLDFSNYLGVCTGKYYVDKITGKHIEHCDTKRGSTLLNIDPRKREHVSTLLYDEEARIKSTETVFANDIDEILNLNFRELCEIRNSNFKDFYDLQIAQGTELGLSKKQIIEKSIKSLINIKPPYFGYLYYRLNQILEEIGT